MPKSSGKVKVAGARRARSARPALKPERIVAEALALVDESGLESLSMRLLASRLGVEAMSIYHYFPSKDVLLSAVSRALEEEVAQQWLNPPRDWRQRIVALGRIQVRTILAHPNAVLLMTARSNPGGSGYITIEAMFRALADAGLEGAARLHWSRTIIALINGTGAFFVPLTAKASGTLLPPDPRLFPLTAEAIAIRGKVRLDPEGVLERGLRPMIAAIEKEVAERA